MYISGIKIANFRNFHEFSMDFHDGLNVIVGANNAGKTGLLKAINLLSEPGKISIRITCSPIMIQNIKSLLRRLLLSIILSMIFQKMILRTKV